MTSGHGTNIDTSAVSGFAQKADGIHNEMQGVLRRTDVAVQNAISPAVWQGDAARQFDGVTTRYQEAQAKLRGHMQEIIDAVSKGAQQFNQTESNASSGIAKSDSNLNMHP